MAYLTVSNASELSAALKSASSGDTIGLASGNYGSLRLMQSTKVLTLESVSETEPATFQGIEVGKSANLTFDGLAFQGTVQGGWGTGTGLNIYGSRNIKVEDSDFQDFQKGLSVNSSQGISVISNEFARSSNDAMAFSNVDGLQILDNEVKDMKTVPGVGHNDMIQIHPVSGMSSNVVIRGNVLDSNDMVTHAIYMGNGGGAHRNITIEDNTIISGHLHGITVARTDGLKITGNIVLRDEASTSTRPIHTPTINVADGSTGVQVTANTTYAIKSGTGIGANTIVPVTVTFSDSMLPGDTKPSDLDPSGEVFRFDGDDVRGWTRVPVGPVDFNGGDTIQFADYDAGTFRPIPDGNPFEVSAGGRAATLDSRADLKEMIAASQDVTALDRGEILVLRIKQDAGTHALVFDNIGDADYFL